MGGKYMERVVSEVCQYLLDNLDQKTSLDELEQKFYYNKYHLVRSFKQYTGLTMKEYVNTARVLQTVDPLLCTKDTILKIALNHGFSSQEYYSETFQGVVGVSPMRFRKTFSEETKNIRELKKKKDYLLYLKQYQENLYHIGTVEKQQEKVKKLMFH